MTEKKRICFVCTGNIVRSPLAEHLFKYYAEKAGIADRFEVDSAGTDYYHVGEPPDSRMLRVARRHGHHYESRARQFQYSDLDRFDLILVMDRENRDRLRYLARKPEQQEKIHMLREFDPQGGPNLSVPDPWYGHSDGFEEVYQVIDRSIRGLVQALKDDQFSP